MNTKAELEQELSLYRAGWKEATVEAVAEQLSQVKAVRDIVFDRRFDTAAEEAAYQFGVSDVKWSLNEALSVPAPASPS